MSAASAPVAVRTAERAGTDRPSEDRIFTLPHAVVVLDGASQPEAAEYDGGWIAETLGREISHRLSHQNGDLRELLADAITSVAGRYQLIPGQAPSTTVSIVRWDDQAVEVLVLGDSPVIGLTREGEIRRVEDDRLKQVARQQRVRIAERGGFGFGDREQWRQLVDEERAHRNRPGGYWIAEATPTAAHQALRTQWRRDELSAVAVMTDGVSAGVQRYHQPPDWRAAMELARTDPQDLVDLVHDTEAGDPDGRRWPRSKRHDDKALAVIEFDHARGRSPCLVPPHA